MCIVDFAILPPQLVTVSSVKSEGAYYAAIPRTGEAAVFICDTLSWYIAPSKSKPSVFIALMFKQKQIWARQKKIQQIYQNEMAIT